MIPIRHYREGKAKIRFQPPNPYVEQASALDKAVQRLRQAMTKEQADDCIRSIRYFLEAAEASIK